MVAAEITWKDRCLYIGHLLFQQLIAIVLFNILWIVYENYDLSTLSAWHVILSSLGFVFFVAEAIALFASKSLTTFGMKRVVRGQIHGALMGLGTVSLTTGIAFKMYQKDQNHYDHFTSTHGKLGLVAFILILLSMFIGIGVANAQKLKQTIPPVWIKFCHNFLGISAYILGMATVGTGFNKFKSYVTDDTVVLLIVLLSIASAYSLLGAFKSGYNQIKNIVSN